MRRMTTETDVMTEKFVATERPWNVVVWDDPVTPMIGRRGHLQEDLRLLQQQVHAADAERPPRRQGRRLVGPARARRVLLRETASRGSAVDHRTGPVVAGNQLFVRRRDGRIEVRLNDAGRVVAREAFGRRGGGRAGPGPRVARGPECPDRSEQRHRRPASPTLNRQSDIATNAELAVMTLNEQFLNESEAWAWLSTFQLALRSTAVANGLVNQERLESCESGPAGLRPHAPNVPLLVGGVPVGTSGGFTRRGEFVVHVNCVTSAPTRTQERAAP